MKRLITLLLVVVLVVSSLAGCGKSKLYYSYDMNEYITVGDYSNEIDIESSDYYSVYSEEFYELTFGDSLKSEVTEGTVESGDVANIDFKGLIDGVAFDGGTGVGYDLTIGSNSFIDGFEDGLIGVEIGSDVSLDLKFPDDYHSSDLAGKDVVFEVTVNYVTKNAPPTDDNVTRYGYKSLEEYEKAQEKYAAAACLYYNIYLATTINVYPEKEETLLYNYAIDEYTTFCTDNNMTIADLASANGMTEQDLYDYISENEVRVNMEYYMIAYYILQKYDAELAEEDIEAKRAELNEKYDESLESIGYNEIIIQQTAAFDKALEILKNEVQIKK